MRGLRILAQCLRVSRNHLAKHSIGPVEEVSPLLTRVFHRQLADFAKLNTSHAYTSASSAKLWSGFAKQCTTHVRLQPLVDSRFYFTRSYTGLSVEDSMLELPKLNAFFTAP